MLQAPTFAVCPVLHLLLLHRLDKVLQTLIPMPMATLQPMCLMPTWFVYCKIVRQSLYNVLMLLISANSFQATQIVCGLQGLLKALAQCSRCSDIISHPIPCINTGCHQSYLLRQLTKHICAWPPCFFQLYGIYNNSLQETVMMSKVIVFNGTTSPEVHKDNPGGWCAGSLCSSLGAVRRRWWPCCWGTSPCPGRPTLP